MIAQLDLQLESSNPLTEEETLLQERLITLLFLSPDWATASDILSRLTLLQSEDNRRRLRKLAAHSDGQVISGQLGYRHILHATAEEIHHAAAWLEHQAQAMGDRARAIRRRAHSNLHHPSIHKSNNPIQ